MPSPPVASGWSAWVWASPDADVNKVVDTNSCEHAGAPRREEESEDEDEENA